MNITLTSSSNEKKIYQDSTYELVSKIAYLLGVPKRIFENEHEPPQISVYDAMQQQKSAQIIRNLSIVRSGILRNYRTINKKMHAEYKSIISMPEFVPTDCIQKLEEEIAAVKKVRSTQRRKRLENEMKLVCIVGYTNAGKSTLLNSLTGAGIQANNRLFDTLDPTTRSMETTDGRKILISDTVGFIRNLPHHLVDAFRATLEELVYADILIHVIDASDENWPQQADVVEGLIRELGAGETPRIMLFNKIDKLPESMLPR